MSFILGIIVGAGAAYAYAVHVMNTGKIVKQNGYDCHITVL